MVNILVNIYTTPEKSVDVDVVVLLEQAAHLVEDALRLAPLHDLPVQVVVVEDLRRRQARVVRRLRVPVQRDRFRALKAEGRVIALNAVAPDAAIRADQRRRVGIDRQDQPFSRM